MSNGSASCDTDTGPRLSLSTIARRVGSPRARKMRSMSGFFLDMVCRFRTRTWHLYVENQPPTSLFSWPSSLRHPASRMAGPSEPSKNAPWCVKIRSVQSPSAGTRSDQRRRNVSVAKRHRGGNHNALVGDDVLVVAIARQDRPGERGTGLEAITRPLNPSRRKSISNCSTSWYSLSTNQRRFFAGSAKAANTRSGQAG
jgi:hypothetical protein